MNQHTKLLEHYDEFSTRLWAGLILLTLLVSVLATAQPARSEPDAPLPTVYVAADGNCWGATPCYPNVMLAVNALGSAGGLVKVAGGIYTGYDIHVPAPTGYPGPDFLTVAVYVSDTTVTVRGGYGGGNWNSPQPARYPTRIWPPQGRGFFIANGARLTLENLSVTGNAVGQGGHEEDDDAYDAGGAIYLWDGGLMLNNVSLRNSWAGTGLAGGLYARTVGPENRVDLYRVRLENNNAGSCAAGYLAELAYMTQSLVVGNGGPLCVQTGTIINSTFADNQNVGLWFMGDGEVSNTQFVYHTYPAWALAATDGLQVYNSNFYGNGYDMNESLPEANRHDLTFENPRFANPAFGDYHLTSTSPRDNGLTPPAISGHPAFDYDAEARPAGAGFDIGAYEYPHAFTWDEARAVTVLPGETVTLTHWLTNTGNYEDDLALTVTAPWPVTLLTPASVYLEPHDPDLRATQVIAVVTVPANAVAGAYAAVTFTARSANDPTLIRTISDSVTVEQLGMPLYLTPANQQRDTSPAAQELVTLNLVNHDNVAQSVNLTLSVPPGWTGTLSPTQITVAPFSSAALTVTANVPVNPQGTGLFEIHGLGTAVQVAEAGNAHQTAGIAQRALTATLALRPIWRTYLPAVIQNWPFHIEVKDAPFYPPGYVVEVNQHFYHENFDHPNDNDWYQFTTYAGVTYTLTTCDLGANNDTVLYLYAPDMQTKITENDDINTDPRNGSQLMWTATETGIYHLLVRHYDWHVYGTGTEYTLALSATGTD